jgi:endonuclease YncB( thermonuclease family)
MAWGTVARATRMPLAALVLLCALTAIARADVIRGRVVGIADGDTITVLDASRSQHRIRLQGIDAPESRQAFGARSKQHLSDLAFDKEVTVEWEKRDRYGRVLGKVLVGGRDACLEQVRAGMAWHYKYYENEQNPQDRRLYAEAEREARGARRGLWADPTPVPPWDFRRGGREPSRRSPTQAVTKPPAERPPNTGQGNPAVQVWVNTNSGVYHCPGTRWYGRTKQGLFMTQRAARAEGNRPAYGSVCQ